MLSATFALSGCTTRDVDPDSEPAPNEEGDADSPAEASLAPEHDGAYGPDDFGFAGSWLPEAGPDSQVELSFDSGSVCLSGTTAQVPEGEWGTYWGAQATFTLCEDAEGEAQPVKECLDEETLAEFVGIAFSIQGPELPWLVSVRFNEAGREDPATLWTQQGGEVTALFSQTSSPFDAEAPPVDPAELESVTLRAAGSTDGEQSFDFCVENLRALFGEEWETAQIPDWLGEPGPGKKVDFVGANLVGAEFGEQNLPGVYGEDYIYPGADEVDLYQSRGMNIFRVPFRWERMQRELFGELDETELGYLKETIAAAAEHGATVIIDPHNFARYEDDPTDDVEPQVIGVDLDTDAFADFWARLAAEFKNDELVWFGLMNEPHDMPTETWLEAANAAIAAIRDEGAENLVLVPGNEWTGAHAWFDSYYGTPNSDVMTGVVDPGDNFAFELHQYFDADSSGRSNNCVSETIGVERVQYVTDWLYEQGFRGFLGEFGGSDDPVCLGALDNLLTHLGDNSEVWLGWTIWAASQWNIQHNIRPNGDQDTLQMQVLFRHMD